MQDCERWKQKKEECRSKHGDRYEKCCIYELHEKRCLAFCHCPNEAETYYGTLQGHQKALCASFEEAYCFGNPRIMNIDSAKEKKHNVKIFESHQKALGKVKNNRQRFRDCQAISKHLTKCMKHHITT